MAVLLITASISLDSNNNDVLIDFYPVFPASFS